MGVAVGGPCVGLKKHQGAQVEPPELCAVVTSHKWYRGPTCKNCYERNKICGLFAAFPTPPQNDNS